MKKISFALITILGFCSVQSQNINDALLYSQTDLNGTARFRGMSGAFGALGGDFSALSVNPAGSVVFANNQIGFTLSNYNLKNNSNYFGAKTSESDSNLDLNQAGGVYVFENYSEKSDWKKFAIAVNYENSKSLDNSIFAAGSNPTNSLANYFLSYANGIPLSIVDGTDYYYEDLFFDEQQAYLGYQSYMINPVGTNAGNTLYTSNVPTGVNYDQEYSLASSGFNGKLVFNGAAQYKDKLMFGLNLNSHFTDYRQSTSFYESNSFNNTTTDYLIKRVRFNNELYTYGTGFSFQVGTIYKPVNEVRIGLAYESPTWYRLNDELSQSIASVRGNVDGELSTTVVNPQVTMVYETYKLQTPGKVTGSFAYIFGKKGLISIDYAMKDYSSTKFAPKNDFTATNAEMKNVLDVSNEIRVGGEYKIQKFSLRGGYRFEESPYKNGKTIGDLTGYSAGIGYNFGTTKLDLAYSFAEREYQKQFFSQGLVDSATINSKNNNISLTLLFEL